MRIEKLVVEVNVDSDNATSINWSQENIEQATRIILWMLWLAGVTEGDFVITAKCPAKTTAASKGKQHWVIVKDISDSNRKIEIILLPTFNKPAYATLVSRTNARIKSEVYDRLVERYKGTSRTLKPELPNYKKLVLEADGLITNGVPTLEVEEHLPAQQPEKKEVNHLKRDFIKDHFFQELFVEIITDHAKSVRGGIFFATDVHSWFIAFGNGQYEVSVRDVAYMLGKLADLGNLERVASAPKAKYRLRNPNAPVIEEKELEKENPEGHDEDAEMHVGMALPQALPNNLLQVIEERANVYQIVEKFLLWERHINETMGDPHAIINDPRYQEAVAFMQNPAFADLLDRLQKYEV